MFGWFDEDGGSKIFWFETTKGGYQKLVRPDGTSKIIKKNMRYLQKWDRRVWLDGSVPCY